MLPDTSLVGGLQYWEYWDLLILYGLCGIFCVRLLSETLFGKRIVEVVAPFAHDGFSRSCCM